MINKYFFYPLMPTPMGAILHNTGVSKSNFICQCHVYLSLTHSSVLKLLVDRYGYSDWGYSAWKKMRMARAFSLAQARQNIAVNGFWGSHFKKMYLDAKVFNPHASSNRNTSMHMHLPTLSYWKHEAEKTMPMNNAYKRWNTQPSLHYYFLQRWEWQSSY